MKSKRWVRASVQVSFSVFVFGCGAQRAPETAAPAEESETAPAALAEPAAPEGATRAADAVGSSEKDEAPAMEKKEKSAIAQAAPIQLETDALDDALQPEQLSCQGARPHRDAICSIAERLCELPRERPSTTKPSPSCENARQSCDAAKSKFKARCG